MRTPRITVINPGYVIEAQRLFGAMTVKPPGQQARQVSNLISRLQRIQVWNKIDVAYLQAGHDAQAGLLNLKNPTSFLATAVNSPTFAKNLGYTGNGTNSYLNTNWSPGTNGVTFTQNSAHISAWSGLQRAGTTGSIMGTEDTGPLAETNMYLRYTDNSAYARIEETVASGGFANTTTTGFFSAGRSSSTARDFFRNGISLGSYGSVASVASTTQNLFLLATNSGGTPIAFSTDTISFMSAGGYLTANEQAAFFRALKIYMDFANVSS